MSGFVAGILATMYALHLVAVQNAFFDDIADPLLFKDVRVAVAKAEDGKDYLFMLKNDYHFFSLSSNSSAEVDMFVIQDGVGRGLMGGRFKDSRLESLYLVNNEGRPVCSVDALPEAGRWGRLSVLAGNATATGENYIDIDLDGQMDVLRFLENTKTVGWTKIRLNGEWTRIYNYDNRKATATSQDGEVKYAFEGNVGWHIATE